MLSNAELATLADYRLRTGILDWDAGDVIVIESTDDDEMDAPKDWDAGTITFDPYVI